MQKPPRKPRQKAEQKLLRQPKRADSLKNAPASPRRAFEPFEQRYSTPDHPLVAGTDEVGRGALAGPVSVGYVIFPPGFVLPDLLSDLDDSKMVPASTRERLAGVIKAEALFSCVVHVSNRLIDKLGISHALESAFASGHLRACRAGFSPGALLMDGKFKYPVFAREYPELQCEAVVKGDRRIMSIAAASILAKVSRDRRMREFDRRIPGYEFETHKGYGTALHRSRIQTLGPSVLHRKSFALLASTSAQGQLFEPPTPAGSPG